MRAYELREAIGVEGVVLNPDRPTPEAGHGEILVRVCATSLNYRDLLIAKGAYRSGDRPNVIPLSDGAGDVAAYEVRCEPQGRAESGGGFPQG